MPRKRIPIIERVMAKVVKQPNGCWQFVGASAGGYGVICLGAGQVGHVRAHRVTYEHFVGPIPAELEIDHLCRNRACVNPAHLEPVTHRVNCKRGLRGQLHTHCKHGHPFDKANTHVRSTGRRDCLACRRIRDSKPKGVD